jgi:polar amino acid transport system permease protein
MQPIQRAFTLTESTLKPVRRTSSEFLFYALLGCLAIAGFLYLFGFRSAIELYFLVLVQATGMTLIVSAVSIVLAILFGAVATWGQLSQSPIVRGITTLYIELIRGTPTLVQLLLWGFGIGSALAQLGFDPHAIAFQVMTVLKSNSLVPANFNFIFYGILGLSFNYGAYLTEVFEVGIKSTAKGQSEAALSLGMDSVQTMRRIILPQAIRLIIPPFTNNFITAIQDSALLSTMGVMELQQVASAIAYPQTDANLKLFIFILAALFYFGICYPLTRLAEYWEQYLGKGQ